MICRVWGKEEGTQQVRGSFRSCISPIGDSFGSLVAIYHSNPNRGWTRSCIKLHKLLYSLDYYVSICSFDIVMDSKGAVETARRLQGANASHSVLLGLLELPSISIFGYATRTSRSLTGVAALLSSD